ncbi:MAG TPA: hypothetical protein VJY62_16880 [Bacteroidia bacterium]|nr:hypothetical protein [Bacteroidia bacterium]
MENLNREITIKFDKTILKDLLIYQIATNLQQHWNDNEVIELFLESNFNFIESNKTKAEKLIELIETHKTAISIQNQVLGNPN